MIIVVFDKDSDYAYASGLWQWHYGQVLRIQGLTLPSAVEIHFSLQQTGGEAVTRIGVTKDGVTDVVIPDSMLENEGATQDYNIYAFIYLTDDTSGETIKKISLSVKARPRPEGRKSDDTNTMAAILKAVNEIADGKADSLKYENNILTLLSGDTTLATVTITGGAGGADAREIELQKGATAIQWRYVGDEEWTDLVALADLKGDPGTDGQDGLPGADGQDGADGITPHISDNGNWYIGDTDTGKPSRGETGASGAAGADGTDGRGITSVTINTDGHLLINYTDDTNVDAGKVVGNDGLDGASGVPVRQAMTTSDTTAALQPNILYVFPEMSELTITLASPTDTTIANEYHWIFTSGSTATTLTIPDTVSLPDGFTIEASKVYEISVMEDCLSYQSWAVTA